MARPPREDLHRSVQQALEERLRSSTRRPAVCAPGCCVLFPTTMAALRPAADAAGRCRLGRPCASGPATRGLMSSNPSGAHQLTTDDLRDPGDALTNLRQDSVVSNAMSADTDFHVNYRRVELRGSVPGWSAPPTAASATCLRPCTSSIWCCDCLLEARTTAGLVVGGAGEDFSCHW